MTLYLIEIFQILLGTTMKFAYSILTLALLITLPILSHAEIYKWKDKDGTIRYTDTPPPNNIKQQSISGKKLSNPTGKKPLSTVTAAPPASTKDAVKDSAKDPADTENAEDAAAEQRQRNAESDKLNKQEKETQAKAKEQNCIAAKSNLASYTQGGRVYKMNEKGEREYMGDGDLKAGKEKSQQEVNEYCS